MIFMYTVLSLQNFRKQNKQALKKIVCLAYTSTLTSARLHGVTSQKTVFFLTEIQ
jgi:hypothetical protein